MSDYTTAPGAGPILQCIGNDPTCPCQDGDACHYKDYPGSPAWPVRMRPCECCGEPTVTALCDDCWRAAVAETVERNIRAVLRRLDWQ